MRRQAAQRLAQIRCPDAATTARISALLDNLARVRAPETVAISPDGTQLAWTVGDCPRTPNSTSPASRPTTPSGTAGSKKIQDRILSPDTIGNVTNLRPGRAPPPIPPGRPTAPARLPIQLRQHDRSFHSPALSRDLFLWTLATNRMQQISHLHGEISDLQWSPDGQAIAFLFVENATHRPGATNATAPLTGVIGQDHVEVQRVGAIELATACISLRITARSSRLRVRLVT